MQYKVGRRRLNVIDSPYVVSTVTTVKIRNEAISEDYTAGL